MTNETPAQSAPLQFYTVPEAARVLRVDPATVYRAIRAGEFPAVRVRTRYVVPSWALEEIAAEAAASLRCVDLAQTTTNKSRYCPCGALAEERRLVCAKCTARARWTRHKGRRSSHTDNGERG